MNRRAVAVAMLALCLGAFLGFVLLAEDGGTRREAEAAASTGPRADAVATSSVTTEESVQRVQRTPLERRPRNPRPLPGSVVVRADRSDVHGDLEVWEDDDTLVTMRSLRMTDGLAVIPGVHVNAALRLTLRPDGWIQGISVETSGPSAPGERRSVTIPVPQPRVITGRLLHPDGRPVRGPETPGDHRDMPPLVTLHGARPGQRTEEFVLDVDPEGRFRIVAGDFGIGNDLRKMRIEHDAREVTWSGAQPLGGRAVELGDLALSGDRLAVSGWVVDSSGAPVAGGQVTVRVADPAGGGSRRRQVSGSPTTTRTDGSFSVIMSRPHERLRVEVESPGPRHLWIPPRTVPGGTQGLRMAPRDRLRHVPRRTHR